MELKALQSRLQAVLAEAGPLARIAEPTPENTQRFTELIAEGNALKAQLDQVQQLTGLQDFAGAAAGPMLPLAGGAQVKGFTPAGSTTVEAVAGKGLHLLDEEGEGIIDERLARVIANPDYKSAFKAYVRRAHANGLSYDEIKTLNEGSDSSGGFLVPPEILNRVISRKPTPTRVAGKVTTLQTSRDQLTIPKVVYNTDDLYTTGIRVTWTGEQPASATAARVTDPIFGQVKIPVHTAMMTLPITNDMIEDANFPILTYIADKFSETIELLRDNIILTGTGIGQPYGILNNPGGTDQPATVKTGDAALLKAAGLQSLAFALPEQYDMNATWVINKTSTGLAIAQMADTTGRYLWGLGLQDSGLVPDIHGRPLMGYPVMYSGFMPNVGAGNYPIIFGDLTGYTLVNRVGFSIRILNEIYAESNQVLVLGRIRFGGFVTEPWKLRIQLVSA